MTSGRRIAKRPASPRLPQTAELRLPVQFLLPPLLLLGPSLANEVGQPARAGRSRKGLKDQLPLDLPPVHRRLDDPGGQRRDAVVLEMPGDHTDALFQLA